MGGRSDVEDGPELGEVSDVEDGPDVDGRSGVGALDGGCSEVPRLGCVDVVGLRIVVFSGRTGSPVGFFGGRHFSISTHWLS